MPYLNLKPNHKPVRDYFKALEKVQQVVQAFVTYNFYALVAEYHRAANPICSENAFDRITDAPFVTLGCR